MSSITGKAIGSGAATASGNPGRSGRKRAASSAGTSGPC